MLAPSERTSKRPPLPVPSARLAAELAERAPAVMDELGPAVMADDPCAAVFGGADPSGARNYYRARYYDPKIGRFISEDPIGFEGGGNLYAYARNNPQNLTDPLGLVPRHPRPGTRDCKPAERAACEVICGEKGVESCKVSRTFRGELVTGKDGRSRMVYRWVDGRMSCSCNDTDDDPPVVTPIIPPGTTTVCPVIIFPPCMIAPEWCCNGEFVGPSGCAGRGA